MLADIEFCLVGEESWIDPLAETDDGGKKRWTFSRTKKDDGKRSRAIDKKLRTKKSIVGPDGKVTGEKELTEEEITDNAHEIMAKLRAQANGYEKYRAYARLRKTVTVRTFGS